MNNRIEMDQQRAGNCISRSWEVFAALAAHITQWSGTTHWQKQVTGTVNSYPQDCYGTGQTGGWGGPQECLPEVHQAAGSRYLIAKYWLQKHLLTVQTGAIWMEGIISMDQFIHASAGQNVPRKQAVRTK